MWTEASACTHLGGRQANEDAHCVEPDLGLFAVADGMGGHAGGAVASAIAIRELVTVIRRHAISSGKTWCGQLDPRLSVGENLLTQAILAAHRRVCMQRSSQHPSLGTTVAALMLRRGKAVIAHVGDSRVYHHRAGRLQRLTRDHAINGLFEALDGQLPSTAPPLPYSHLITQALGMRGSPSPDLRTLVVEPGDRFLLCTDGLLEGLDDRRIDRLLARLPAQHAGDALVRESYARGGSDNITAVVVEVRRQ